MGHLSVAGTLRFADDKACRRIRVPVCADLESESPGDRLILVIRAGGGFSCATSGLFWRLGPPLASGRMSAAMGCSPVEHHASGRSGGRFG